MPRIRRVHKLGIQMLRSKTTNLINHQINKLSTAVQRLTNIKEFCRKIFINSELIVPQRQRIEYIDTKSHRTYTQIKVGSI